MLSTRGNIEELFESLAERRDRRVYSRSDSSQLTYIDLGDGNGGIALNIGEGGLALTAAGTVIADYFPTIRFQLPKIPGWIETSGRVVWTSESKKGAGICFDGITEIDRERIRCWVSLKVSGGREIEGGAKYVSEKKHASDSGKHKKEVRKLEVLSEADAARFAAMFPSESTLQKAAERGWTETETEVDRELEGHVEPNPREPLEDLLPDTNREALDAKPSVELNSESTDTVPDPGAQNSELGARDADAAGDIASTGGESVHALTFPRRRWIIDRTDDPLRAEDAPRSEQGGTQFGASNSSSDHRFAVGERPTDLPVSEQEEGQVLQDARYESIQVDKKPSGEWTLPTFTYPREADWRQQFVWSRGGAAAEARAPRAVARVPERNNTFWIALLILLVAAACFVGGLIVGNGSVRKLVKLDGGVTATNSPATSAPESNSAKSNEPIGGTAKQANSTAARDASASGSSTASNDEGAPRHGTPGSKSGAAQSVESQDVQEASASNQRPEVSSIAPSSRDSSSSGLVAESSANPEHRTPHLPAAMVAAPETGAIAQSQRNPSTPEYSEATVDKPYSEVQSPVLVTPPDEKSGPFRLAFPETAVSASRTLAISAQRFVLIPSEAGPASSHRPARLQAGVLIYHADPVPPASGEGTGGTVKVRATIGKGGDVVDVRAISGPISLIPRVVRAVREWRYTVTLLDGQPLGSEEDVVVEFRPRS